MSKGIPEVMKTELLGDWVIVTKKTNLKGGGVIAETKYPIPEKTIWYITNSHLIKQLEGCENGYTYKTGKDNSVKVTVERVKI